VRKYNDFARTQRRPARRKEHRALNHADRCQRDTAATAFGPVASRRGLLRQGREETPVCKEEFRGYMQSGGRLAPPADHLTTNRSQGAAVARRPLEPRASLLPSIVNVRRQQVSVLYNAPA
jgi:hypothetical protein